MITYTGDRVTLKSFTRESYHQFQKNYISDPIMDPNPHIYDYDKTEAAYARLKERESWYPRVAIMLNAQEQVIGEVSFKRIDFEVSRCELGIVMLNNDYKNQGLGSEAFSLAITYAINKLKLSSIYADTMGTNIKMQRILEKNGFELMSTDEQYYNMGDRVEDRLNYVYRVNSD